MLDDLEKLNEQIYRLYGSLYENSELLTKEQAEYTAKCLFVGYKSEYELIALRAEIEYKTERFAVNEKRKALIPRRWRKFIFWKKKNRSADILLRELNQELEGNFAKREIALEKSECKVDVENVMRFESNATAAEENNGEMAAERTLSGDTNSRPANA